MRRFNNFLVNIYKIISNTNNKDSKLYRQTIKLFDFSEINNIDLGHSKGRYGSGFDHILTGKIISDAKEIIDAENKLI